MSLWLLSASSLGWPAALLGAALPMPGPDGGQKEERLHYALAYRGLFTAFVWKALAEVTLEAGRISFEDGFECELALGLSTAGHPFAELLRPTRYRWISRADLLLERLDWVEWWDLTDDDLEHRLAWVDWSGRRMMLFKLLKRRRPPPPLGADGRFLASRLQGPPEGPEGRWFSYHKERPLPAQLHALNDPLSFLQAARWHDWRRGELRRVVAFKDEFRHYRARLLGRRTLTLKGRRWPVLLVELLRRDPHEADEEGFLRAWFSDDGRRLPLRFEVDGVIGRLRLELRKAQGAFPCGGEASTLDPH